MKFYINYEDFEIIHKVINSYKFYESVRWKCELLVVPDSQNKNDYTLSVEELKLSLPKYSKGYTILKVCKDQVYFRLDDSTRRSYKNREAHIYLELVDNKFELFRQVDISKELNCVMFFLLSVISNSFIECPAHKASYIATTRYIAIPNCTKCDKYLECLAQGVDVIV